MTHLSASVRQIWHRMTPVGLSQSADSSFERSLADAEELLAYAAESGTQIPPEVATAILRARTSVEHGVATDEVRGAFYEAYTKLSALFGEVTATTIRNCTAPSTGRKLARNKLSALLITLVISTISVGTFVADSVSKKILEDIEQANDAAVRIRVALTEPDGSKPIRTVYAETDPCDLLATPPMGDDKI